MSSPGSSPHWYRVSGLHPRLVPHAHVQRVTLRGEICHVMHNRVSGRSYRFSGSAHHFVAMLDGRRSVEELCNAGCEKFGDDALSQEEIIELLRRLHVADLLQTDTAIDSAEIFDRRQQQEKAKWIGRVKNPLAIRIPLFDPDRLLARLLPIVRPLFGHGGFMLWVATVMVGLIVAAVHWQEIASDTSINILSAQNLVLLGFCYPLIKLFHELGHGLATKIWGGEVHETGVLLLALMPVPYVDASSASTFPEKRRRMLVGAAGVMVELFLAVLALALWLNTEAGVVHSLAYNIMLIGSVSTLFFNGNPLLRFDGYYVLSDAIGMPNLSTRSTRYLGYLVKRYLFGVRSLESPASTHSECAWLAAYGVLAFVYRMVIMVVIVLFVAEAYPAVGMLVAIWATVTMLVLPLLKHLKVLLSGPALQRHRFRALSSSGAIAALVLLIVFALPAPLSTIAEGVIAPPEHSELRAGNDGTITRLVALPDTRVVRGQPLIETEDPFITVRIQALEAKLRELAVRRKVLQIEQKQVEVDMLDEEIRVVEADLKRSREQARSLVIHSPADGVFLVELPGDMPGRFVRQGDLLGYVADLARPGVRVAVPQADIGLIRAGIQGVTVRLVGQAATTVQASITRQVPAAVEYLPSAALGPLGGGPFAVDPQDPAGTRAMEDVFEMELALPIAVQRLGSRVYVRFDHGNEPLGRQWYRRVRQLFLRKFNV